MAASAWRTYDKFLERLSNKEIDLDNDTFKIALFTSASDAATVTTANGNLADLTNQVANGNGYTTGGATITSPALSISGNDLTWTASDPLASWTASGGSITARFAVIYDDTHADDALVAYCLLDTTPADVVIADGTTFQIKPNASGILRLDGATA